VTAPDNVPSAAKIIQMINEVLKTEVTVKLPMKEVLKANLIAAGMLFAFVLFIIFGYGILMNRIMWAFIITPVWIACHGGWVYIKMMGANPYGHHEENGKLIIDEWFMRTAHG